MIHDIKISVVIPAFNEETGIGHVLEGIRQTELEKNGYAVKTLVIDNASTDATSNVATRSGARVISEPKRGKGNALKSGFRAVSEDCDYVVMIDADDTYEPTEIPRLLEPLQSGFADVIVGSRLIGHTKKGSMSLSHRLANWLFTFPVRHIYKANVTDICSGFWAFKSDVVRTLLKHITASGFAVETDMVTKLARLNYRLYSVPITYHPREGNSKLSPIRDGFRILGTIVRNLRWHP